jgi:hypothetical protein
MRYLLFICTDPEAPVYDPADDDIEDWVADVVQRDMSRGGNRLRPVETAKTVRKRNGEVIVTDGPFAETREWIAGYDLLECASLDEALEVASRHPMARYGRVEVRAEWPFGEE